MKRKRLKLHVIITISIFVVILSINKINAKYTSRQMVTDNLKLIVSPNTFTLTLIAQSDDIVYSKVLGENEEYGTLPVPEKKGYHFDGWYTDASNGQKVDSNTSMGNADTTVYAHWTPNTLTINYHNGGATYITWEGRTDDVEGKDVTVFQQETYGKAFSNGVNGLYDTWRWNRTGYKAKGGYWKIGENGTKEYNDHEGFKNAEDCAEYLGVLDEFEKGDVTVDLYPIWIANTYTIKYDKNSDDATGSISSSKHTYDVEQSLNSNKFSRTGFTFVGWNEKADGTGKFYKDEEKVINLTSTSNGTITLYAQWEAVTYNDIQTDDLITIEEKNEMKIEEDVVENKDDEIKAEEKETVKKEVDENKSDEEKKKMKHKN